MVGVELLGERSPPDLFDREPGDLVEQYYCGFGLSGCEGVADFESKEGL